MKALITIFLIFALKTSASEVFVDIRTNTISPSIKVYHGTFFNAGRYSMLIGYGEPIKLIRYGRVLLFPRPSSKGSDFYIVELFNNFDGPYVMIAVYEVNSDKIEYRETNYWKCSKGIIYRMNKEQFFSKIVCPVYLHLDMGSNFKHPFIEATVSQENDGNVKYTIASEFDGMKLNQPGEIQYKFGPAYDSTTKILVGFKIFEEFMKTFDYMIATYGDQMEAITFYNGDKMVNFMKGDFMGKDMWNGAVLDAADFHDDEKREAYETGQKLTEKGISIDDVVLDISENISPELNNIEKTDGKVDRWNYILYQVKEEYKEAFKIQKIIDSKVKHMVIMHGNPDAVETMVETYERDGCFRRIVVTSFFSGPEGERKEVNMFKKENKKNLCFFMDYADITELIVSDRINEFRPIRINVPLDLPAKRLYSKEVIVRGSKSCIIFSINQPDGRAVEEGKYRIGRITDKVMSESGKIPVCEYPAERKYLTGLLDVAKALVTKGYVPNEQQKIVYVRNLRN